ncbi:MAG: hypothetical protein BWZ06_01110 [Bacteroidetes bacterium ADurb.BinA261]|nr:MAG: hypothetical protein BWZ06_01110 [Bacteroidetes bacterium ADurb.BinA261]
MSVIPETGFDPTIAIAFAATVVNRNEITVIVIKATIACTSVTLTPIRRNMKTAMRVRNKNNITNDIFRSRCVRCVVFSFCCVTFFVPTANLNALPITPAELMMPIIPAMAMAPIPMGRT